MFISHLCVGISINMAHIYRLESQWHQSDLGYFLTSARDGQHLFREQFDFAPQDAREQKIISAGLGNEC